MEERKQSKLWVKASEIKEFVFCPLSWWYKSKGYKYEEEFEELLEQGAEEHLKLGKQLDALKEEQVTKIFLLIALLAILAAIILFLLL